MIKKLCCCGIFILSLQGCSKPLEKVTSKPGLFSWKKKTITEQRSSLFQDMKAQKIKRIYQSFPDTTSTKDRNTYLRHAKEAGLEVFQLIGDPTWGMDREGKKIIAEIDKVHAWNQQLSDEDTFAGIMIDVEPYLNEKWEQNQLVSMNSYVLAMRNAYQHAKKLNVRIIACIPYFYDTYHLTEDLEELIHHGCDEIAIMNYQKRDEIGQVETEVAFAKTYDKPVTIIYELQAPGTHDLTKNNTYYHDGMDAINKSWKKLYDALSYDQLSIGLHDYEAMKEVIHRE